MLGRYVDRVSAILLLVVGAYVVYYWLTAGGLLSTSWGRMTILNATHKVHLRRLLVLISLLAALLAVACAPSGGATVSKSGSALEDVRGVADLQGRFNADAGKTRLLLIVSPTWVECRQGTSWVQNEILTRNPSADVRVYAVWLNMLSGDSRAQWNSGTLNDSRATHLWDEPKAIGMWFAQGVSRQPGGIAWDVYALYGPDARWSQDPPPPVSSGGTIIARREQLRFAIAPLLIVQGR
jgi:hypothetical protein